MILLSAIQTNKAGKEEYARLEISNLKWGRTDGFTNKVTVNWRHKGSKGMSHTDNCKNTLRLKDSNDLIQEHLIPGHNND